MQHSTTATAAQLPFGRRHTDLFSSNVPGSANPRTATAHTYHAAQNPNHTFPVQHADPSYHYVQEADKSNVPAWLYNSSQQSSTQSMLDPSGLPFQFDQYAQPSRSSDPIADLVASSVASMSATLPVPPHLAAFASTGVDPFHPPNTGSFAAAAPASAAQMTAPDSSDGYTSSVPPLVSPRRASDETSPVSNLSNSLPEAGLPLGNVPFQSSATCSTGSVSFKDSTSPNTSSRMSGSPEVVNVPHPHLPHTVSPSGPPGGMIMGAPVSSAMLNSIDSWLAPAISAPAAPASAAVVTSTPSSSAPVRKPRNVSPIEGSTSSSVHSSAPASSNPAFHPGSSDISATGSASFKTSVERRERNKASQRESRKRKQDRMETLESENASLRKALADMKKFSQALSNGAGMCGQDGSEIAPIHMTKFTGAIHLDLIQSQLEDDTVDAEWKGYAGNRFPAQKSSAQGYDGSESDSDEIDETETEVRSGAAQRPASTKTAAEKRLQSAEQSQSASQQARQTTWEISINQKRQKAVQSFPSMVAVPELVLYKVCRLYFSTLLPFSTKLKSGIVNLRVAREVPSYIGGFDDLPRFPGDPSLGPTELYLPKNLMPTETQLRIGFHPIEIAVMPYPAMRDRVLTILSAFQSIEEQKQVDQDRFTETGDQAPNDQGEVPPCQGTELTDEDIRKRTALVSNPSAWKPKDYEGGAVVIPDKNRIYSYGFLDKPRGSTALPKPAQLWLDAFFLELVQTLRVWSPAGDVFDGECFEFKESFFRKYPYIADAEMLRATNRWRRARGEDPIRL